MDSGSGTAMMYFWNYDAKDDKLRSLYRMPEFKQAMSFALDRPTIQQTVYYGTGILTTGTMSPKASSSTSTPTPRPLARKPAISIQPTIRQGGSFAG